MSDTRQPDDGARDARALRREARATLDAQLDALSELDRKAMRLLQFTAGFVSAVAAVFAFAPRTSGVANVYTAVGVGAFLCAALTESAAYAATPRVVGIDADGLERALAHPHREDAEVLLRGYADWIRYNDAVDRRAGFAVSLASMLVAAGTVALGLGVVRAFVGPLPVIVPATAAVAVVATAGAAGLHRQAASLLADGAARRPTPPAGATTPEAADADRPGGQLAGPPAAREEE